MKVGNVKVERHGTVVRLHVESGIGWVPAFDRNAPSEYHAELEVRDIYAGLREGRKAMQREVLDALLRHKLQGRRRGKLARAVDDVKTIYGL